MHASEDVPATVSVRYWWGLIIPALHSEFRLCQLDPDGDHGLPHVWSDTAGSADGIALYPIKAECLAG